MPKVTMVVTGDKELNRKLSTLRGPKAKKAVRQSTRPALKPVLQETRATAPILTGKLKKNIKIRALPRSRKWFGSRVTSGLGRGANTGEAFYGAFLEFGTKTIKARKFMKNAADRKRKQALNIYRTEISKRITQLAKNG